MKPWRSENPSPKLQSKTSKQLQLGFEAEKDPINNGLSNSSISSIPNTLFSFSMKWNSKKIF
jgi:hypothetical protein